MSKKYFDIIRQYWDKPAVTEPLQLQMSPNAHTADLLTRSRYRAEGAQTERERIIKLLEKHSISEWCGFADCPAPFPVAHLAQIIKGEQK